MQSVITAMALNNTAYFSPIVKVISYPVITTITLHKIY